MNVRLDRPSLVFLGIGLTLILAALIYTSWQPESERAQSEYLRWWRWAKVESEGIFRLHEQLRAAGVHFPPTEHDIKSVDSLWTVSHWTWWHPTADFTTPSGWVRIGDVVLRTAPTLSTQDDDIVAVMLPPRSRPDRVFAITKDGYAQELRGETGPPEGWHAANGFDWLASGLGRSGK
ncbi:MAG: hypothetical protein K2W85_12790 [Phycisphaerales bacterium]|nr:hypothetical protein [Phycisphaerales bacterium]